MKYSLKEIASINQEDKGINGRFYEDVEGYIYIGKGTRLFKYAKCSEVSMDIGVALGDNVCDALNNLRVRIVALEGETVAPTQTLQGLYHLQSGDDITVKGRYEYFIACNLILDSGSRIEIENGGRLVVHSGAILNDGVLTNNGIIKIGL